MNQVTVITLDELPLRYIYFKLWL